MTISTIAANMTDAQFDALAIAADREDGFVPRFNGVSLSTLRGLDGRRWAELVWKTRIIGGRNVRRITGATITGYGRREYAAAKALRDTAARNAQVVRLGVAATARDPFAVVAAVNGPELVLPF
jgi:hypothetical protein